MTESTPGEELDVVAVLEHLPHRYPFLLVDRVLSYTVGERLRALKNVTMNEQFFQGHFPGRPVMPGVLILEALAQATGILGVRTMERPPGQDSMYFFVGIDKARFKRPVVPGDQLILDVVLRKVRRNIWMFYGEACVDGRLAASAELMCTHRDYQELRP
jgi:3-hydroxyacyl-[acyl-carrier-protein] dehydratase